MSSSWPATIASLDGSLALLSESVGKLKAAQTVDIPELVEQLKTATESAENLRAFVSAELPEASWQSREELDALIVEVQKRLETRTLEQLRSRLLTLAAELERGGIVQTDSPLRTVEYQPQSGGGFLSNRSLIHGNPFANVSMTHFRPEADRFQTWRTRTTGWITAVGVLIAAVAVLSFGISFHRQLGKLRTQLTESSEARTEVLQEGMRTEQRAWVGLMDATVHPLTADGGGFTIKLQNTGKTPALALQIADVITIGDVDQAAQLEAPNTTVSAGTLMPGAVYTTDVWFKTSPDAVSGLTQDRLRAANYIYVTYKDVFERSHVTKACFYWSKSLPRVKPCDRYNELN